MKKRIAAILMRTLPNFYFSRFWTILLAAHMKPYIYADQWNMQPFNGQIQRAKKIRQLAEAFKPTVCIETGTYFGTSTPHLASLVSGHTYTIEIDPINFGKAQERLNKNYPMFDITCILGDSAKEIAKLLRNLDPKTERVLAYLDAHWLDAIPTKRELELLLDWGGEWIAIVDDFQVPHDAGYEFDAYGDVIIGETQVPKNCELEIFVPSESAQLETGARRGTGYIIHRKSFIHLSNSMFVNLKRL